MKSLSSYLHSSRRLLAVALVASASITLASTSQAQIYWDINGAAAGATNNGDASGTWDAATTNWSTNSAGTIATTTYSSGGNAVFSAGTNTVSATINVSGAQAVAGRIELQEGAYTFSGSDLLFQAPEMIRNASTAASTINNNLIIAPATSTGNASYTVGSSGGNLTVNGNIGFSLSGATGIKSVILNNSSSTSVLTFAGQITGTPGGTATSSLSVGNGTSNGVVVISGDNSALNAAQSGQVTSGVVRLANAKALGSGTINIGNSSTATTAVASLLTDGALTITNSISLGNSNVGAVLTIGGNTAQTSSFTGAINLNGSVNNSLRFSAVDGGRVNFEGVISNNTGTMDVIKEGVGVVAFSGTNTYTRNTVVNVGTLLVNNSTGSGTGTGAVTVASGSTLGGTGRIGGIAGATGDVTISGIAAPGDLSSIGTLTIGSSTVSRNTFLSEGSTLSIQTGLNTSDRLVMFGNFDLSGNQTLALSGTLDGVNNYVVATFTGALTGTFENVTGLSPNYAVQYNLNNITLTVVPEPSTVALALIGVAGLFVVYRRNRRVNA